MILRDTEQHRAEVRRIARAINKKAIAAGFDSWTEGTFHEIHEQLADTETAFDILADQKARLGLDLWEETRDLKILFSRQRGEDGPTSQEWLSDTYTAWLAVNHLPADSADELLADGIAGRIPMTDTQKEWLREFGRLWDNAI